ncbi:TetR family transcriptional regulator [Nocardioides anomalus]|uniref:TetR family transcriptional regulator n=1 Tax=Nocardioides anomalus TaxID=2712223 RepID=A0A6G6WK64_9ACTN|nr:TetR/AcrR family transcriptional regulator [Nocardioides anomalus]QIG45485.1 TetR family transcriptional regulator [Nocardioides anomalus]
MARWEPDAAGRLRAAALDLYVDQGYEQTTVAEIAERAGVTARTFFRHYADKREVLFAGSDVLVARMVEATVTAPADATPLDALGRALDVAAEMFGDGHDHSSRRQRVLHDNPELLERELAKMAMLASALAGALEQRGVAPAAAEMVAEAAITVFRVGFDRWATGPGTLSLQETLHEALAQLRTVVG